MIAVMEENLLVQVQGCVRVKPVEDGPSPREEIQQEHRLEMNPCCQVRAHCGACLVRGCSPRHGETGQHVFIITTRQRARAEI